MIKTIQHLAEADSTRVLVALDLKAAFQNVSRRAMLNSIEHTDPDAAVFSRWYTGSTKHRMHFESSNTKITASSGVDQGCPLSTCGFSAATEPVLRFTLADLCRLLDDGAKLFAYLDDWYPYTKPQCLNDALVLIAAATRSVNLELQASKNPSVEGILSQELLDKVKPTLKCLGGHLHIQGTASPVLWSLVNRTQWRKPRNVSVQLLPPLLSSMLRVSACRLSMISSPCLLVLQANMCCA